MGGVFLFHATRPFQTIGSDWHVFADRRSVVLTVFAALLAQWIPTTLFMVSGAAAYFAVARRTTTRFIQERSLRLLVPFAVGALVLTPVQLFVDRRHRGFDEGFGPAFLSDLWEGIISQPDVAGPRFFVETGLHLWFLGFLFVCSVLALPLLRRLGLRRGGLVAVLAKLSGRRLGLLVFVVPLAVSRFLLPVRGPGRYDWADFGFLLLYFLAGAVFFADDRFLEALRHDRWLLLAVAVASDAGMVALFGAGVLPDGFTEPNTLAFFGGWTLLALVSWSWTLVVLEAGRTMLDFAHPMLTRWGGGAIAFYVIHQPVLIVAGYFVVRWAVPLQAQFWTLLGVSSLVTLGLVLAAGRLRVVRLALGIKRGP